MRESMQQQANTIKIKQTHLYKRRNCGGIPNRSPTTASIVLQYVWMRLDKFRDVCLDMFRYVQIRFHAVRYAYIPFIFDYLCLDTQLCFRYVWIVLVDKPTGRRGFFALCQICGFLHFVAICVYTFEYVQIRISRFILLRFNTCRRGLIWLDTF